MTRVALIACVVMAVSGTLMIVSSVVHLCFTRTIDIHQASRDWCMGFVFIDLAYINAYLIYSER